MYYFQNYVFITAKAPWRCAALQKRPSVKPRIALQPFRGADASCVNCWLYSNRLFLVAYAVHFVAKHHCCHGVDQLVSVKLLVGINCHAAFTSSSRLFRGQHPFINPPTLTKEHIYRPNWISKSFGKFWVYFKPHQGISLVSIWKKQNKT